MAILKTYRFLGHRYLTLNNNSNDIFTYRIDFERGYSLQEGARVKVDKPNCIYILKTEV